MTKAQAPKQRTEAEMKPVDSHPLMVTGQKPRLGVRAPLKKDLTRYVRWPLYIRVQRQRSILMKRLKVPPAIAQFNACIDKNQKIELMKVLEALKPESKVAKRNRIREEAKARAEKKQVASKKPICIVDGLKEVVSAIEKGKAKLVVIASDVDPIEQVIFIPALCRKMKVPFCFINGKAVLGQVTGRKKCTTVAVTETTPQVEGSVKTLADAFMSQYNNNVDLRRAWGGTIMSNAFYQKKAEQARIAKAEANA